MYELSILLKLRALQKPDRVPATESMEVITDADSLYYNFSEPLIKQDGWSTLPQELKPALIRLH